jgi:hypothetical protein
MSVAYWSEWDVQSRILSTRLTGSVRIEDIARWEEGLHAALAQVEEKGVFKLLTDLSGYELQEMAAHKAMRVVVPQLLATHGMRPAVLDLFPEVEMPLARTRGIVCIAYANVHHDVEKMAEYDRTLSRADQRFFTDVGAARMWLLSLSLNHPDP